MSFENLNRALDREILAKKESREKELRAKLRMFKIEVTQGFFFKRVKYIQRDVPLTDEEIDAILKQ